MKKAMIVVATAALAIAGCASHRHANHPLESAHGTLDRTGFARSSSVVRYASADGTSDGTTLRVGQAASVVEGPRGDRLWRISVDGTFLEFCRLLDERPYDCVPVPLPGVASAPTLLEPGNLGAGALRGGSEVTLHSTVGTHEAGSLPTTPRFGVWVLLNPFLKLQTVVGILDVGSALAFCHIDSAGEPRCVSTETVIVRAFSLHVVEAHASIAHVLWGQPVGEGVAIRCEADDASGLVKCVRAEETNKP